MGCISKSRDRFVYAPSQWKMPLQYNVVCHWTDSCIKSCLHVIWINEKIIVTPHMVSFRNKCKVCTYTLVAKVPPFITLQDTIYNTDSETSQTAAYMISERKCKMYHTKNGSSLTYMCVYVYVLQEHHSLHNINNAMRASHTAINFVYCHWCWLGAWYPIRSHSQNRVSPSAWYPREASPTVE